MRKNLFANLKRPARPALVAGLVAIGLVAIGLVAMGLAATGCGSSSSSVVGTWKSSSKVVPMQITIKPDGTFTSTGIAGSIDGNCSVSGNVVKFYPDTRNGGGPDFGTHWDGSYDFTLNADHTQMTVSNGATSGIADVTLVLQPGSGSSTDAKSSDAKAGSDTAAKDGTTSAGTGSDRSGSDKTGSDKAGSDKAGSDKTGSDKASPDKTTSSTATSDTAASSNPSGS